MAAETTPNLDRIADLANSHTLAELRSRAADLDRQMRAAPADTFHVIEAAGTARDALLARRRVLEVQNPGSTPTGLQRRIDHLDRRVTAATAQQERHKRWLLDHSDLIEEHQVVNDAERAVEARIRQHPTQYLPDHVVAALGTEPSLQRERHAWNDAASAVAIHWNRHGGEADPTPGSTEVAAVLGERPSEPEAAASWQFAAAKIAAAGLDIAVDSGAEL